MRDDTYERVAEGLSASLVLLHQVLANHPPSPGPCPGCWSPRSPAVEAPCPLHRLAGRALELRAERGEDNVV